MVERWPGGNWILGLHRRERTRSCAALFVHRPGRAKPPVLLERCRDQRCFHSGSQRVTYEHELVPDPRSGLAAEDESLDVIAHECASPVLSGEGGTIQRVNRSPVTVLT